MPIFYRALVLFIITLCTGCNNSSSELIAQQRANSNELLLSSFQRINNSALVSALTFSSDSQYLMVNHVYDGILINILLDDKQSPVFDSKQYSDLNNIYVKNADFIDNNHIYIAAQAILENEPSKFIVSIYQLSPKKLLYSHDYGDLSADPVKVSKNFIAIHKYLTNWHSKKNWEARLAYPSTNISGYQLTNTGQVVTYNWQNGWILLSDPSNDKHEAWSSGLDITQLALSYNDSYLIVLSRKGSCAVWRLADRSKVGRCGGGNWFNELRREEIVINSQNDQFAVIRDNRITVYSLPSMDKTFDLTFEHAVGLAHFSGDLLVVTDEYGRAELWQVNNKKLLGTVPYAYRSTIQPNGEHLALIAENELRLYKIPK